MKVLLGKNDWFENMQVTEETELWGDLHGHTFIEIVYFDAGGGFHCVNGQYYSIKKGDVFLVPPGVEHFYTKDVVNSEYSGTKVINLIFNDDIFDEIDKGQGFIKGLYAYYAKGVYQTSIQPLDCLFCSDFDHVIYDLLQSIKHEQETKDVGYWVVMEANLKTLIAIIFRRHLIEKNERLILSHQGIAMHIVTMIEQNYKDTPKIVDIANKFGFSESSIRRIFKEETGVSFWKFVQQVRIKAACRYLVEGNLSVETVMEKVGMSDKKQFYELFKREVGMTPKEYKNSGSKTT